MNFKLQDLQNQVKAFRDERNWKQFHNPKDLAQAISIEASELLEHFLWYSQEMSYDVVIKNKEEVSLEMADILAYLLSLADVADINLGEALLKKIELNKIKYPIHLAKNNSTKYTKL